MKIVPIKMFSADMVVIKVFCIFMCAGRQWGWLRAAAGLTDL